MKFPLARPRHHSLRWFLKQKGAGLHNIHSCLISFWGLPFYTIIYREKDRKRHSKRLFLLCWISQSMLGCCCIQACEALTRVHINIPWVTSDHAERGICLCLFVITQNVTNTVLFFPGPQKSLAHFCYVPFLVVCVCTALYVWFFLPETKGKSFLEISEEFRKRNFKTKTHAGFYKGPEEIKTTTL